MLTVKALLAEEYPIIEPTYIVIKPPAEPLYIVVA